MRVRYIGYAALWFCIVLLLEIGLQLWLKQLTIPVETPEQRAWLNMAVLFAFVSALAYYGFAPSVKTSLSSVGLFRLLLLAATLVLLAHVSFGYLKLGQIKSGQPATAPFSTPGSVFVVALALITATGFALTITKLDEIHGRILTYPDLMERVEELVKLEHHRVFERRKDGEIYILANAPAFGNVSAHREFDRCKGKLAALLSNKSVDVHLACKSWLRTGDGPSPLEEFYQLHWPNHPQLSAKISESMDLINNVVGGSLAGGKEIKRLYRFREHVEEAPYHLFITSKRAILFTALTYPYVSRKGESSGARLRERSKTVEIIGFETGDAAIIEALKRAFLDRIGSLAELEDRPLEAVAPPIVVQSIFPRPEDASIPQHVAPKSNGSATEGVSGDGDEQSVAFPDGLRDSQEPSSGS